MKVTIKIDDSAARNIPSADDTWYTRAKWLSDNNINYGKSSIGTRWPVPFEITMDEQDAVAFRLRFSL